MKFKSNTQVILGLKHILGKIDMFSMMWTFSVFVSAILRYDKRYRLRYCDLGKTVCEGIVQVGCSGSPKTQNVKYQKQIDN